MAAVIRENECPGVLDPLAALSSVPWPTLESVLQPNIKLQEHQRQGIAWLWSHYQAHRSGALLADEMGLGKTLQIGCFLALQSLAGREDDRRRSTIIVCPKILIENWRAEMERYFRPGMLPRTRELRNDWLSGGDADVLDVLQPTYFVLSYDAFARYQQELLKRQWASAILDESQNIKNPDTYRARAARGLKRTFGICATGTPVENRLRDLWTQFDFLSPGKPFSTPKAFCSEYECVDDGTTRLRVALRYPSSSSPVLHREKRDILRSLPAPTVEVHALPMTREQATEEERIVRTEKQALKILGSLQKLYQHPALLRANQAQALDPKAAIDASPKLHKCIELLQRVRAAGEKALIFTLWSQMQELLGDVIQYSFGFRPNVVNGASNQSGQSKKILERFSEGEGFGVLIMSPLAAGAGLNVTAANHVIHYGRWWNPAKEDQATARAHRIGQTRNVHVHYLVLHDPDDPSLGFDRKLHDYVEQKRQTASDFLAPTEAENFEHVMASVCRGGAQP
jgi:SNF2 family DNA or RNA helicase